MKVRNRKTGEIGELKPFVIDEKIVVWIENKSYPEYRYNSLAELNAEWCDAEEDELLYVISAEHKSGYQCVLKDDYPEICEVAKELGIGFETEEECQIAVNKLQAWKRLKDKGLRFERWGIGGEYGNTITFSDYIEYNDETRADLDLLFGGEE